MALTKLSAHLYLDSKKLAKLDRKIKGCKDDGKKFVDKLEKRPNDKSLTRKLYRAQTEARHLDTEKQALVKNMERDAEEFLRLLKKN